MIKKYYICKKDKKFTKIKKGTGKEIMTEIKVTKRERFNEIIDVLSGIDGTADLVAFVEDQIALLDRKAAKAKETAATKKAEDALLPVVEAALTDELSTIADIVARIDVEDMTAKAASRLNKLVASGVAVKDTVKVDKRTLVAFKLA